jgi:FMN phosphatase YigB (HAD superfamily)
MVKAIVFDYGGVISLLPRQEKVEELAKMCGTAIGTFQKAQAALRNEYDRGSYDCAGLYRRLLATLGVHNPDTMLVEKLVTLDLELWKSLNTETLGLIADLERSKDKNGLPRVGVLTNMSGEFLSWLRSSVPLFKAVSGPGRVDFVIASCELLLIKPEKAIYDVLLERLKLPPEDVVFFDDNKANVDAACEQGIRAFVFKSAGEARSTLHSLGLRF